MPERWREAVEEKRDELERVADAGLPISGDCAALLAEADAAEAEATG